MKAIVATAPGGPEVLKLEELPEPKLVRDTDILVRVRAAGVNPVDTKMRAKPTGYPVAVPKVLGCDGAGVVEATGKSVTAFKPGDEIYYCQCGAGERLGSYAEYAVVDHRLAAPKPKSLSFEQAAAVPLVLITAWESLHDHARLQRGHKVLIHAGAGGVGHVALQLAHLAGAEVCTTVSSPEKAEFAVAHDADKTILYKQENFVAAALDWSGGAGVDIALDTVGGQTLADTFSAVRYYGDVVTLLNPGPEVNWSVARVRNQRFGLELMLTPVFFQLADAMARQGEILRRCAPLLDEGSLTVHVDRVLPLADAAAAHALFASSQLKGKVVLGIV
jgi:NADPH:quinone reductase